MHAPIAVDDLGDAEIDGGRHQRDGLVLAEAFDVHQEAPHLAERILHGEVERGLRIDLALALRAELSLTALAETKHWPVADDQEIIRVPHATWSNALTQLDAGAFVDVLIPVTTVEARATGARRIREAKTAIRDGRYEHAVALARAALDPVREALNTRRLHDQAVQKKAGERDQEERWAMLTQSAYALFSGAPHDDSGTTENFTWTRADAVAAVATAAGLLARLEELP